MANAPILDLTKLSPAELAQLQRVLAAMQQGITVSTAPDFSGLDPIMVCHNPDNPHAYKLSDIDALAVRNAQGGSLTEATHCPDCGARLGFAPIAIGNKVVELQHASALRAGDPQVVALYHNPKDDDKMESGGEGEPTDAKPVVVTTVVSASPAPAQPVQSGGSV